MMLIAMIIWGRLLILIIAGVLIFKLAGCGLRSMPGVLLKTLGVAAVIGGLWMLLARDSQHHEVVLDGTVEHVDALREIDFPAEFVNGDFVQPFASDRVVASENVSFAPDVMMIVLGSGLIILGAILFGRERTRPVALKAITLLGVGAIIYSVVNYFGDPPRAERFKHRIVHREVAKNLHQARRPSQMARTTRARRPSLRPERPAASDKSDGLTLPERASEIPVSVTVTKDPVAKESQPQVTSETTETATSTEDKETTNEADGKVTLSPENGTIAQAKAAIAAPIAEVGAKDVAEPSSKSVASRKSVPAKEFAEALHKERPTWVDAVPGLKDGIYSMTINSGPYVSVPESQRALDMELQAAADHYINEYLGDEHASQLVNIPLAYLTDNVKKVEFVEKVQSNSVGPMYQLHARLEFDEKARADFQRLWRHAVVQDRLWYTGGGAALVLALLATFYGYLRLDLKTDTAHRGRLQLAATLVALIVAAGALLARWAVPF